MARTAAMANPCLAGGKGAKVPRRRVEHPRENTSPRQIHRQSFHFDTTCSVVGSCTFPLWVGLVRPVILCVCVCSLA